MNYRRLYSHPKDIARGLLYDQSILLNNFYVSKDYPEKMRRIKFNDEIQRLIRDGLSFAAIGKALVLDQRTVKRYSRMNEAEYCSFLEGKEIRDKLLRCYEPFVRDKLEAHPAVSAAQMHDWLKEYHPDLCRSHPRRFIIL